MEIYRPVVFYAGQCGVCLIVPNNKLICFIEDNAERNYTKRFLSSHEGIQGETKPVDHEIPIIMRLVSVQKSPDCLPF